MFPALEFCFSVVVKGPLHELWMHFKREEKFHMVNLKIWRTAMGSHSKELLNCLGLIVEWGKGDFKKHIVKLLNRVPKK